MELFPFLGSKKLNDFIWPNPYDSAGLFDVTKGIDDRQIVGLLGAEWQYSEGIAAKLSNTTNGTVYNSTLKLVRLDTGSLTVTDVIVGRPLFWVDKTKFTVTPVATATTLLAGIAITPLTSANAKGDLFLICVQGDVGVLLKASSLTKASPVGNDPAVLNIASSLATADTLADATGWTNVQLALRIGRVIEAWNGAAGTVKKVHLDNAYRVYRDGVK